MTNTKKAEQFLISKLNEAAWNNSADRAYRIEHSFRVANIAKQIAVAEGMNADALYIGGMLHDVAYCEKWDDVKTGWLEHGRRSAAIAKPFMESLDLDGNTVQEICYGIAIHVDDKADFDGERTSFALSIGAADNIDRFDVYRIYEELERSSFKSLTLEEKMQWLEQKKLRLPKLYEYIESYPTNPTADRMLKEKLDFRKDFYSRLKEQLKLSK